jgi:SpoVK/Ycf46/Vps4 family AAA+-type ATPase
MKLTQWQEHEDFITAASNTRPHLEPGMYEHAITPQGTLLWIRVEAGDHEIIRFPDTAATEVVEEIERFWERERAFLDHGLPFKRGILLWGPPGSGKSSTLQLLARDVIARGGIVAIFDGPGAFKSAYRQLREIQPETPLVVFMEDLDALLKPSNESDILNLLDGVTRLDKVVFVATTNYPGKLGARIVNRPSRFDRRLKIAHPSEASRRMYLETLLAPGDEVDLDAMVKDTKDMSLAHVKELFVSTVLLQAPYAKTVKHLKTMNEHSTSDPTEYLSDDEELEAILDRAYA